MTETTIEYAAHYPFALEDDEPNTIHGPVDRSQAESMVRFVNARLEKAGRPAIAVLMERKVTRTDWTPANTGIVPPHIGNRIDRQWEKEDPRVE